MPITRTPIQDDDGSGTTGTPIDNAWKQEFYNQIDALAAPQTPVYGSFTPVDHYGVVVPTTNTCTYAKVGRLVTVQMFLVFPTITGNPNIVWFDGLPFSVSGYAALVQARGVLKEWEIGGSAFFAYHTASGLNVSPNDLSGTTIILSGSYVSV